MSRFKPFSAKINFKTKEQAFALLAVCMEIGGHEDKSPRGFFERENGPSIGGFLEKKLESMGYDFEEIDSVDYREMSDMTTGGSGIFFLDRSTDEQKEGE